MFFTFDNETLPYFKINAITKYWQFAVQWSSNIKYSTLSAARLEDKLPTTLFSYSSHNDEVPIL
jgi:NADH:ubiquinone oxidoreductase subunit H